MKRFFDIILSIIVIVFLSIPMLLIMIAIRLSSKGPALYWSDRVGIANSLYKMPKFRSMRIDTPEVATHLLLNANKFLTPIGGFLRRTSLDELPQLVNVLTGNMSLVGPRPLFPEDNEFYDHHYLRRLNVLPGITGLLQINERNTSEFETWYKYDIEYIENWTLYLDLKIILKTPFSLLKSKTKGI